MLSLTNYSNSEADLIKLLKYSGVTTGTETICDELNKHPDYGSLLAVSDVLIAFNIGNTAFRATHDELSDTECPFVALISAKGGGELFVARRRDKNNIYISSEKFEKRKLSHDAFKKMILFLHLLPSFYMRFRAFSSLLR